MKFFGDVELGSINKGDAQRFQEWLIKPKAEGGDGLAANSTARRMLGYCVSIFQSAIDDEIISKNPFKQKCLKRSVKTNHNKHFYVNKDLAQKIYNAIPQPERRLRFVLMRFAGYRSPSELNDLKWKDVDWENNQITIQAQKNRHQDTGMHVLGGTFLFPVQLAGQ